MCIRDRPIASITKVMTLLLTFEAIHNGQLTLETTVPVSEHAYHMGGSQIWLEPGEQFTLDEMIKAICVSSANDAAVAVAELVGGSEPAFVERMNARAAELGMEHTTFHNACGLDTEGHLSTARDLSLIHICTGTLERSCHKISAFPAAGSGNDRITWFITANIADFGRIVNADCECFTKILHIHEEAERIPQKSRLPETGDGRNAQTGSSLQLKVGVVLQHMDCLLYTSRCV